MVKTWLKCLIGLILIVITNIGYFLVYSYEDGFLNFFGIFLGPMIAGFIMAKALNLGKKDK